MADVLPLNSIPPHNVPEAGRLALRCVAPDKFYPAPTFEWYGPDGNRIQTGVRRTITFGTRFSVLEINPVYVPDAGLYSCNATNSILGQTVSTTSQVTITCKSNARARVRVCVCTLFSVTSVANVVGYNQCHWFVPDSVR